MRYIIATVKLCIENNITNQSVKSKISWCLFSVLKMCILVGFIFIFSAILTVFKLVAVSKGDNGLS